MQYIEIYSKHKYFILISEVLLGSFLVRGHSYCYLLGHLIPLIPIYYPTQVIHSYNQLGDQYIQTNKYVSINCHNKHICHSWHLFYS